LYNWLIKNYILEIMAKFDSKVDKYVAESMDFAKPIMEHWRQLVHDTCPEVVEAIKWSLPHFDYRGDFMCVMAAYKSHCSFTFLKSGMMTDVRLQENKSLKPIQRFLGKITRLEDLPPDEEFIGFLKEAMQLNEQGMKFSRPKKEGPSPSLEVPDYFQEQLDANPAAKAVFESKSPNFRKEYLVWITDAKTDATREKRMDQAIEWIAEGKGRNWKYQK
jgi:uncharacterized protein YdeI (YjbR/CyaY-like superfamily)